MTRRAPRRPRGPLRVPAGRARRVTPHRWSGRRRQWVGSPRATRSGGVTPSIASCSRATRSASPTSVTPTPRSRNRSPTISSGERGSFCDFTTTASSANATTEQSSGARSTTAAAATAAVASRSPCMEPERSTSRHTAVSERFHVCTTSSSVSSGAPVLRDRWIASSDASRSMSPSAERRGRRTSRSTPVRDAAASLAASTTTRPASRPASSRRRRSVAVFMSASSASAASGASSNNSSNADSSTMPTSGETSAKRSSRASSRRDTVRRAASATASRAASPSLTSSSGPRPPPGGGVRLFPRCRRRPDRCSRCRHPRRRRSTRPVERSAAATARRRSPRGSGRHRRADGCVPTGRAARRRG